MPIKSKAYAQKRTDQIASFKAELEVMEKDRVISLTDQQHGAIDQYHSKNIKSGKTGKKSRLDNFCNRITILFLKMLFPSRIRYE